MPAPRLVLVTPAASAPVSDDEAREHLRLEAFDTSFAPYLAAAIDWVERYTGRALVTQTWEAVLDQFPEDGVIPLGGPLASVTSVVYLDASGAQQTLGANQYQVDTTSMPGRVVWAPSVSWPETSEKVNAVRVRFVAGTAAGSVPAAIKAAILLMLGHLYERREESIVGTIIARVPMGVEALLAPYRIRLGVY